MLCSRCYTDATWSLSLYCCRRIDRIPRSSPSSSVSAFTDLYAILELVTILTKSSRSSSSNSISNNKKWMGRRITGTITFSFTHRPWLLRITQSAILYMGGTPDTDNDDDHFQTHPTEQSTGNIQLAAAVLLFFFLFFCIIVMSVAVVGTMHALLKQSIWGGNSSRRIFLIRTNILWECQQNKKTYNQGRWKWIEDSTRLFFFLIWFGFCWLVFCILSFVFIGRGRWPHIYYAPEGQHDGNCNRSKQFLPEWKQTATGFYGRMLVRNLLSINGITNITITSPWRPSTCCWNHDPRTNEIKQIEYSTVVCIYFSIFFFSCLFLFYLFVFVKKNLLEINILFQWSYINF